MRCFTSWTLVAVAWMSCTLFSTPAVAGMVATPRESSSDDAREILKRTVRERAADLGIADRIPERALAGASAVQLTALLGSLKMDRHAGYGVEVAVAAVLAVLFVVFLLILLSPGTSAEPPPPPAPPRDPVQPIRNCAIKIIVTSNLTYNAVDETAARGSLPNQVLGRLGTAGSGDGNTFSIASGEAPNFTFHFTVNNDGNDRFSGSVDMSGWGWGHIATIYSGEYTYASAPEMIDALTDKAYTWIHNGWREAGR